MQNLMVLSIKVGKRHFKFTGQKATILFKAGVKPGRNFYQVAGSFGQLTKDDVEFLNQHRFFKNYFNQFKTALGQNKECFVTTRKQAY